jgi:hypothetical protein
MIKQNKTEDIQKFNKKLALESAEIISEIRNCLMK